MSACEIAAALGGTRREGRQWRCRCPLHGGQSLVLTDGRDGHVLLTCWGGCDRLAVLAELRRRGLLDGPAERGRLAPPQSQPREKGASRIAAARRVWDSARDARGSPVERYLRSRGIDIPPPPSLRWAPACHHPSGIYFPAMVAAIVDAADCLIGVHRTFLRADGSSKAAIEPVRAMLGRTAGGAVRLAPAYEALMIGEGLETCLAAMTATGLPGWSAISAGGIEALTLPELVKAVIILADHDPNARGERAARAAARRWLAEGRQIQIALPPEPGTDFNDVLLAGEEARCDTA